MTGSVISQHALQFIAEHIDTVPQLECLLLLHQDHTRAWMVEDVAGRIYSSPQAARVILESLQRRGFLVQEGDPPHFRFDTNGSVQPELIGQVADEYSKHLVQIATFIHSKASASVREFARAFDLKRDR